MILKRLGKKLLKIAGYISGGLVVLLIAFHIWFIHYAKDMLEDVVEKKSKGKIRLTIKKLSYNYFSNRVKIKDAVLFTTDTVTAPASYRFSIKQLRLQIKSLWPLITQKKLLIDSLYLQEPEIQVTNLRYPPGDSIRKNKKDISIPGEMGKVYNSIQDALNVLNINRFQINDGKFILLNKIQPGQLPLVITNIDFHIDNLQVDTSRLTGKEKFFYSDNLVLKSKKQDITFPDGRHRLSFEHFRINIRKKLVEFDSCTISAVKTDSTNTSFSVFFDKLLLTHIDFDTLYKHDVIKADTVFCLNPVFKLQTEISNKKESTVKSKKLETIIQQLTGDLLLGFVLVNNASFDITTTKNGYPNSFTSHKNNFEMQGLSIDQGAPKPIHVKGFAMAIRNYENFIKDSIYSVQFDSILFKENHISLSNFLFHKLDKGKIINTFNIPHFYLGGVSWDELVFEKKLKAERATMFDPVINYTVSNKKKEGKRKRNIFQSLAAINNYMDLQSLDIVHGRIALKIKENQQVNLENATLSIKSHSLLSSTKLGDIKQSLTKLKFDKGVILAGDLSLELDSILYINQSGQFGARSIQVTDKEKNTHLSLRDVSVEKMQMDEQSGNIFAKGVKWQHGDIQLNLSGNKKGSAGSSIELRNVEGHQTAITGTIGDKQFSTKLNSLFFTSLEKKPGRKLKLDSLAVDGKQLHLKDSKLDLSIADYQIADNKNSSFLQVIYDGNNGKMDAHVRVPSLKVIPHIQPILNGDIALDDVKMDNPVFEVRLAAKNTGIQKDRSRFPEIDINELTLNQPAISLSYASDSGMMAIDWHGERTASNFLHVNDLHTNKDHISLGLLKFFLTDLAFTDRKGKTFKTGEGKIAAQINNFQFEQPGNLPAAWTAHVSNFDTRDFRFDSLGKSKGNLVIKSGSLDNLNISSSTITNLQKLVAANSDFLLQQVTGHYTDANTNLSLYNAGFTRSTNFFSLDSFSMTPALSKDSFIAKQSYQADYIKMRSGAFSMGPVDIDSYFNDKTLNARTVKIDKFLFTDFKDKQLPFHAGIIKPLPVNLLKKIPLRLSLDTILLNNARVEYTETGEKTKKPGHIPVTRMMVRLSNVKNYGYSNTDSLTILTTGYLMDSVWTRLKVKESYTDTQSGFIMTLRMRPAGLRVFNPALVPLASAKLESGYLDTLNMRAIGREYLSLGEMKMHYHNLKIRILKDGDETKKSFRYSLLTFLANSFVIRNKNSSRTGQVFFTRIRDRSTINYLIKIAMSGITSSIGAKSNNKMKRDYKKEIEQHNLPPIDF